MGREARVKRRKRYAGSAPVERPVAVAVQCECCGMWWSVRPGELDSRQFLGLGFGGSW